jgi:hypothetical protein
MMARPPEYMEQRIAGSHEDMAFYIDECKAELKECMTEVFSAIARDAYEGRDGSPPDLIQRGILCHERYFNSMKGATNLSADDIRSVIAAEAERQRAFYEALREMAGQFSGHGVVFEILPPGEIYSDPVWNIPLSIGTTVRVEGRAYITAFCPSAAATNDYMAPRQDPVAASLIYMDDKVMLFMQHDQDPGEPFAAACASLWGRSVDVHADFGGAWAAHISGGVLLLDTGESVSDKETGQLMGKYGVYGIIVANSGKFTARLYTIQKSMSRLENEVLD